MATVERNLTAAVNILRHVSQVAQSGTLMNTAAIVRQVELSGGKGFS